MNLDNIQTILVLAPHTDDGEFGCGGSIHKFVKNGKRVIYVAFSAAEQSVLPHLPKDILRREVKIATERLGIKNEDCHILNFEVRKFPEQRQLILDSMIQFQKTFNPDIVFLPSMNDTHQDHLVIAQEGFRAFKKATMLGYEVPWNNLSFNTTSFIVLDEDDLKSKVDALKCYESQSHRDYSSETFIRSLACVRGVQIGRKNAEAFEVSRWVLN